MSSRLFDLVHENTEHETNNRTLEKRQGKRKRNYITINATKNSQTNKLFNNFRKQFTIVHWSILLNYLVSYQSILGMSRVDINPGNCFFCVYFF